MEASDETIDMATASVLPGSGHRVSSVSDAVPAPSCGRLVVNFRRNILLTLSAHFAESCRSLLESGRRGQVNLIYR